MSSTKSSYATVIIDLGSGLIKAGFGGEDGPRSIFKSVVGVPIKPGLLVKMEQKERYIGNEAIEKVEIMNFVSPIKRGEVADWEKFETLLHYLFYNEMKIVPEEASILVTECPLTTKENRRKLSELLFETFNVERMHVANSSMLGLYSYGKSSGLIVDSGYNVTSTVPIYEGYPLAHASIKLNIGGEDLSKKLLEMITTTEKFANCYKGMKGLLLADKIKEEKGEICLDNDIEEAETPEEKYTLPDGETIELSKELYEHCDELFNPTDPSRDSIRKCVENSAEKCDPDIKESIKENICLTGGTTLLKNFPEKMRLELTSDNSPFKIETMEERQFSAWIGGSIVSSLSNFQYMWVSKEEYDANKIDAIDSKCF
ncbi:MAG: rod shape-determining protein [archaeon]|nr:rod shape-determining protein [archaeon]